MVDDPEVHPLAQAAIDAHDVLAPKIAEAKTAHVVNLLEQFETDIAPLVGPIIKQLLDDPATPDQLRPLLSMVAEPQHFGESIIIGIAIGAILSPVLSAATAPLVQSIATTAWLAAAGSGQPLLGVPLSPDLLAAATLKTVLTQGAAGSEAAYSGVNAARFATMVETAGQSMGLAEALLLERRGQFVGITLDDVLHYSNINKKFYDSIKNLKYGPPSVGEVVTGVLKHRLDPSVGPTMIGEAGLNPANFDWLLKSAGRPPGTMEMLDLWNKSAAGLIATSVTQADVDQAVEQSDINDEFLPFVRELRHYFPPPRSVVPMLRSGAITPAQATQLLEGYGVGEPWLSAFIHEGQTSTTGTVKELTQAQIVSSYETRLMDRPTALARLEALKYNAADATDLLDLADEKHAAAMLNATVNMVGRRYVAYKLDKTAAQHHLSAAAVPNAAQLDLFKLWDIERAANVHVLTPASIVGAFRRGEITAHEVQTRLLQGGIDPADLAIMVADGFAPTKPNPAAVLAVVEGADSYVGDIAVGAGGAPPKTLTVTQVGNLWSAGTIGRAEAVADLAALGYTNAQATELLTTFSQPVNPKP